MIASKREGEHQDWAIDLYGRLSGISDLVAEEACYHKRCKFSLLSFRDSCFVQPPDTKDPSSSKKMSRGRIPSENKSVAFDRLCEWLETEAEHGVHTMRDIHHQMQLIGVQIAEERGVDVSDTFYARRWIKERLQEKYKDDLYFTNESRRTDIVCFRGTTNNVLREFRKTLSADNDEAELSIVKTAANVIKRKLKAIPMDNKVYPSVDEITSDNYDCPLLDAFLKEFFKKPAQIILWKEVLLKSQRPKSGPSNLRLGISSHLAHKYNSKDLLNFLNAIGVCESYQELHRFRWSILYANNANDGNIEQHIADSGVRGKSPDVPSTEDDENDSSSDIDEIEDDIDSEISFDTDTDSEVSFDEVDDLETSYNNSNDDIPIDQFVADNIDIKLQSSYGNTSFHAMGMIKSSLNKDVKTKSSSVKPIARKMNIRQAERELLLKNLNIRILHFSPDALDFMSTVQFRPMSQLIHKFQTRKIGCPADVTWTVSWLINLPDFSRYNWKGHMKSLHKVDKGEMSSIKFLPIIDNKPDNFSTVYTTLQEAMKHSESKYTVITFDLPLWIKAVRIILQTKMPVVARLGGFHLLKSFLGCIGTIMKDSGLEDVFQLVYNGGDTVAKILTGGAYYKALRAHFLVDAAFCSTLLEGKLSKESIELLKASIEFCRVNKLGSEYSDEITKRMTAVVEQAMGELAEKGRTGKLWVQYHNMVQLIKDFIRAERLSDWQLHLSVVCRMLPYFAAAGHGQYAKGARLYLELMDKWVAEGTELGDQFWKQKTHTVR